MTQIQKLLFYFFFTLVLLLGSIFYSYYLQPERIEQRIKHAQSSLIEKEELTEQAFLFVKEKIEQDSIDVLFQDHSFNQFCHDNEIVIIVFTDSTIRFWSDNSVTFSYSELNKLNGFGFLGNGWFEFRKFKYNSISIFGLIKVKTDFRYQNQYLRSEFRTDFNFHSNTNFSLKAGEYNIYSKEGTFLFSILLSEELLITEKEGFILTGLYLITLILFIVFLFHTYKYLEFRLRKSFLLLFCFIIDLLFVRFIIFYFKIPGILYTLPLFKPEIFASSWILPSLGDLLINSITLTAISWAIFRNEKLYEVLPSHLSRFIFPLVINAYVVILFILLGSTLTGIINNSSLSFDLLSITKINVYGLIAFLCFALLSLSFIFLTYRFTELLFKHFPLLKLVLIFVVTLGILFIVILNAWQDIDPYLFAFIVLYFIGLRTIWQIRSTNPGIIRSLYFLIFFSFFSSYIILRSNTLLEKESRKAGVQKLANERDFAVEFMFNDIVSLAKKDSTLIQLVTKYPFNKESDLSETINYLKGNYFNGYWDKYDIMITLCDFSKILEIQPENYTINCFDYFREQIRNYGTPTGFENLYYLDYNTSPDNYLGIFEIDANNKVIEFYIEVFSRLIPRGLGYPELLMDKKAQPSFNITPYSWAKYENNELVYHYGKYPYPMDLKDFTPVKPEPFFFDINQFNHLYYPKDDNTSLIISVKNPGIIDFAAPFSYFFIFYSLIILTLYLFFKNPRYLFQLKLNFKRRLQLSIISLVLISFVFIGLGSLYYIVKLNNNKNTDLLKEKAHSVLIELEHKLSKEKSIDPDMEEFLSVLLYKFSLVFFTDINVYDLNGKLLATSRNEIFNKGLISEMMNSTAFNEMSNLKSSMFIHHESIGDYDYLSAYLPLRNVENHTIAYLNLPYFAKQNELTNEIVTYLTAFINIYVILSAIAILITLVISSYISKPIQLLKDKISKLKLGKQNEKIDWVQHDEIGSLVIEYNRMVDELAKSADQLAKSERESAWREMAKQIAHEIKNPLTPMKLSVQYLKKAWDDKAPDWDERLNRFTQTLVEQIESLSKIATEFSDFAKMPTTQAEKLELTRVIENAISLFKDSKQVNFEFDFSGGHHVMADYEQLLRVFINLINNSIQAIPDPETGLIKITLQRKGDVHEIKFADNGKGIPEDQRNKVFYPNFTTKSSGMGLGLAMVKNIIQNARGEISFESEEGKGTTFIIQLPAYEG